MGESIARHPVCQSFPCLSSASHRVDLREAEKQKDGTPPVSHISFKCFQCQVLTWFVFCLLNQIFSLGSQNIGWHFIQVQNLYKFSTFVLVSASFLEWGVAYRKHLKLYQWPLKKSCIISIELYWIVSIESWYGYVKHHEAHYLHLQINFQLIQFIVLLIMPTQINTTGTSIPLYHVHCIKEFTNLLFLCPPESHGCSREPMCVVS